MMIIHFIADEQLKEQKKKSVQIDFEELRSALGFDGPYSTTFDDFCIPDRLALFIARAYYMAPCAEAADLPEGITTKVDKMIDSDLSMLLRTVTPHDILRASTLLGQALKRVDLPAFNSTPAQKDIVKYAITFLHKEFCELIGRVFIPALHEIAVSEYPKRLKYELGDDSSSEDYLLISEEDLTLDIWKRLSSDFGYSYPPRK